MNVSACLVTRGDVDLTGILASLPYDDVVVYDNSKRHNLATSGRYAAFAEARHDIVYVQDDDHILLDHGGLLRAYEPGVITANMSRGWIEAHGYEDCAMVGKGALMDKTLAAPALDRYLRRYKDTLVFRLWADVVVTVLNPVRHVDLETEELPWGYAANRMNQRPGFRREKRLMLARARALRDAA